jgi:putative membrane protein
MLVKLIFVVVFIAALSLAIAFAALNSGRITLDLAFAETEIQKSLALMLAFGAGWLFGLFCAGSFLLKTLNERRKLRKALNLAEAEVRNLRSLPMQDAD